MRERLPFDHLDDRLARAAWSRLAEPEDRAATRLVAALGAGPALDWLLHAERGLYPAVPVPPPRGNWGTAAARWAPRLAGLDPRRELEVIARRGGELILPGSRAWPVGLDDLGECAPLCLWVIGARDPATLAASSVALVGSRASTAYGERVAADLAMGVQPKDITVVSGGAYGIDAAAHRATLSVDGPALAVMAGGLDRYYPNGNTRLLEQVAATGAVVAEAPPGTAPMRTRFLSRNRLIAALARATVVVEAAWRSGALSTASRAAGLFRPVGAVPGPVTSAASAGAHRLIRESGAICVTDAAEVAELVQPVGTALPEEPAVAAGLLDDLDGEQARVLDALPARGGAVFGAVVRSAGMDEVSVRAALGFLELSGRVTREGGAWRRARVRG
ncbi:DNA-protecting protein DprA [Occultella glacieicola]|uniref:DNA-protecting protein DprA n=1 Tax=Occultella glacieicola TaxID=2518684 RepID=A0ABY2DWQ5_9MICO|nr:DNA-processing protein DprA [Occultella glacieicola]TDE88283.1 DNA-protecting protein DprA [Occultella glacieicola]